MAVSKRLRYEVLRRDNHACRYCGRAAPDVQLTIDHVIPVALGGHDKPDNLVTACRDCNAGKSASAPDAPIVDDAAADALRWAAAMKHAADVQLRDLEWRQSVIGWFDRNWCQWTVKATGEPIPRPAAWRESVLRIFSAGLPAEIISEAVRIAMDNSTVSSDRIWRYFCGVCWRRLDDMRETAAARLTAEEPNA